MNDTDRILKMVDMADQCEVMKASETLRTIAQLINRLEQSFDCYADETEALLRIGATVWKHHQRASTARYSPFT